MSFPTRARVVAMHLPIGFRFKACLTLLALVLRWIPLAAAVAEEAPAGGTVERRLYVAEPGIRDYLEYGGHGILVFDIDNGHKFVKRLPSAGLNQKGVPLNVKGIAANAGTARLYVTTTQTLMSFDLVTSKLLWEKPY